MTDRTLGIIVKASADFSDVSRAGEKAAAELRNKLGGKLPGGGAPSVPFMGRRPGEADPIKAVDSLQKALDRAHQAGKRLRDIQFPSNQFSEAVKQVQALERHIAMLGMTKFGRDLKGRLGDTGMDRSRPLQWDWGKLYGSQSAGEAARHQFFRGAFTPERVVARPAASVTVGGASSGGEGSGASGGGLGVLALSKGLIAPMAALAGIGSVISLVSSGYRDHLKVVENIDAVYKATASGRGFSGLMEDARALGGVLQMSSADASGLARQFVSASGATDASAFGRAGAAGQFGRGYGMDPSVSSGLFARAELVGVGGSRSSQHAFARTIAESIGGSGMFTRADQVMGDLVGRIEKVATTQGRTSGAGEYGAFSALLQGLYSNPAMRSGGAQSVLESLDAAGGRGGEMQEMLGWSAFGGAVGWDAARVRAMQEAGSETSPYDLFGGGYAKKTRAELVHEAIKQMSAMSPGATERERYAYTSSEYGYGTSLIGLQQYDLMEGLKKHKGGYAGFNSWLGTSTGLGFDDIEMSGLANLSRLYGARGDRSAGHVGWMRSQAKQYLAGGNLPSALGEELARVIDGGGDAAQLEALMPKVIASVASMGTRGDKEREIAGGFGAQLEEFAGALHPVTLGLRDLTTVAGKAANAIGDMVADILGSVGFSPGGYGAVPSDGSWWARPERTGGWSRGAPYKPTSFGGLLDDAFIYADRKARERDRGAGIGPGGLPASSAGASGGGNALIDAVIKPAGASVVSPRSALGAPGAYPYSAEIKAAAQAAGVSEWALAGIISQESNFGRDLVGDNGASVGFGHFNVGGALSDYKLTPEQLLEKSPAEQIGLVADFLAKKKAQAGGDEMRAIELYNGGGDPNYLENVKRRAREAGFSPGAVPGAPGAGISSKSGYDALDPEFSAKLRMMQQDAEAAGHQIDMYSGYRTYERQAQIFEKNGRNRKWAAPPGMSSHNFGQAADIRYSSAAAREWAHKNAAEYGMQFRMGHEPWHIEPKGWHPSQHPYYGKKPPAGWDPSQGIPANPELGQASPQMSPALFSAIAPNSPNQPNDARWQGQVAMDVTFRTDRGALLHRQRSMAVSEPRVAGSGGSSGDASRFSWNDIVTLPAFG